MLVRACRPRPAPPQQRPRYGGAHFASSTAPRRRTITLTDDESNIVSYLNNVNSHFQLGNTIRVVGGWVRNKLLGRDGGDMDIALDKMTGATFCARLREYQVSRGLEQRRIAVIRANPAQSKHLETATTHIFNHSLDFVHLRSEEYDADSRIPRVVFGTPLQDAQRRDFTVNALYYSTGNRLIEDFTERGLDDLEARVLRTPLEPLRTLLDDPLRALRCVRFAGQLSFEPVDELKAALHDQKMQEALRAKVSRERVNVELSKMCLAESYLRAFELLVETGLAGIIYDIGNFNGWQAGLDSLRRVSRMDIQGLTSEQRDAVVNAAFLWPAYQQLNLVPDDVINFFVQSLRGARRRGENVAALLQSTRAALPLTTGSASTRESLASWLRAAPETWQASVLIAAADKDAASVDNLVGELRALNPAGIRGLRPLLNGTEIAELLKLPRGPQIGVAAQALMRWQLANPTAGRQDAVTWLQQRRFYSTPSSHQFASMTASAAPPGRAHHTDRLVENDIGDEPGALFSRWYAEAALNSPPPIEANAMVLCTASKTGQPSSRTVLLREFDQDAVAFTFFGNGKTRKGSEMAENPRASLLFYWPALGRQVRVEGTVERTSAEESAAVFAVRPRDFQVGSCASPDTGKRLESRELLEASARAVSERVKDTDVLDAPPHWTGWRVRADNLEFLQMHPGLLHDRFAFRRTGERSWARERIAP